MPKTSVSEILSDISIRGSSASRFYYLISLDRFQKIPLTTKLLCITTAYITINTLSCFYHSVYGYVCWCYQLFKCGSGPRNELTVRPPKEVNLCITHETNTPWGRDWMLPLLALVLTAVTIQDFRVPICLSTGRRVIPECCEHLPPELSRWTRVRRPKGRHQPPSFPD